MALSIDLSGVRLHAGFRMQHLLAPGRCALCET